MPLIDALPLPLLYAYTKSIKFSRCVIQPMIGGQKKGLFKISIIVGNHGNLFKGCSRYIPVHLIYSCIICNNIKHGFCHYLQKKNFDKFEVFQLSKDFQPGTCRPPPSRVIFFEISPPWKILRYATL